MKSRKKPSVATATSSSTKKGGRRKQGGRVTEKGPAKVPKGPLTLPGLEDGEGLPPGFPSLGGKN